MRTNNSSLRLSVLLVGLINLSGCASFGKGIAEAVLQRAEEKDIRVCQVWGRPFLGIEQHLDSTEGETKVLMVHGVGDHLPGYSTEFTEKLAKQLQLDVKSRFNKNISLTSPHDPSKKLGNLRISRLLNKARSKELLFYELTWSEITRAQKAFLDFDKSGEETFRRTKINDLMKQFANETGPDPIIYLGKSHYDILTSFAQSFCWMTKGDWDDLPQQGRHACTVVDSASAEQINYDNYVFVSHSLGSRITIDGMQYIASLFRKKNGELKEEFSNIPKVINAMQNQEVPIFMLSNQLPMLQLGREPPEFSNQKNDFCYPEGVHYSSRMISKTSIIAFSDPNDLLSYSIPSGFAEQYLDSRLCIEVTNININIANIVDIFGIGEVANPLDAHVGYDTDDRVVALIAKGIGNHKTAQLIRDRCDWTELDD